MRERRMRQLRYLGLLAARKVTRLLDVLSRRWMEAKDADTAAASAQGVIRFGLIAAFLLFGVFGAWAATAPLDSAAVASGQVVLNANRKAIQHLEGGIIDEIMVQEGDRVKAGQPLLRLHETFSKAKLEALRSQFFAARAVEARLMAERDGLAELAFPASLVTEAENDAERQEVLANQQKIFTANLAALESKTSILGKRITEYGHEIEGLRGQAESQAKEMEHIDEQVSIFKTLFAQGYESKMKLLDTQRQAEEIRGLRSQNVASAARAQQSIEEVELQIVNLKQEKMADVLKELKDTQLQLTGLNEQLRASRDVLDRVVITAPLSGYVTSLNVHTIGGVISPGEKLMEIVPIGDKLIVEAQVATQDIDVVHPGLMAHVRLTAYKTRHMPQVEGKVVTVSADRIIDSRTGTGYYLARIEVSQADLDRLKDVALTPGMPADVLIVTGERTLLAYLFDPLSGTLDKSLRED